MTQWSQDELTRMLQTPPRQERLASIVEPIAFPDLDSSPLPPKSLGLPVRMFEGHQIYLYQFKYHCPSLRLKGIPSLQQMFKRVLEELAEPEQVGPTLYEQQMYWAWLQKLNGENV